jgi:alkylation response protein AidB-like acyl-CoA dehydrogenase
MNFDFTEEQTMLRDSVRRYVADHYSFDARKTIVANGGFSSTVWATFAELGLLGLTAPAESGGSELGMQESMVVMEELGRGIVVEPLAALTLLPIALLSGDASNNQLLEGIADGSQTVAVAYVEHGARYNLAYCTTKAHQHGEGWTLTGNKGMVSCADRCTQFIVPAMTEQGMSLFVVDASDAGVTSTGYGTQDGSRAGELSLSHASARLIGELGQGLARLQQGINTLITAHCAEAVGCMEVLCDMTADYLNTRKQFSTEIGKFQALRHRLVDMRLELELARGLSWKASIAVGDAALSDTEKNAIVSAAKIASGKAMRQVGQGAVQLHGGIAVTLEYAAGHYFKRLTALEMTAGDTNHHLGVLSNV